MSIYTILFIIIWVLSIISILIKKEKAGYIILSTMITFFTIFRFDTGWDFYWYWYVGDKKFSGTWFYEEAYEKIEYGYKVIYTLVREMNNPQLFFIITGVISSLALYYGIYKQTKYPLLALSIYISGIYTFSYSLGFIRQYLAINLVFYSVIYLIEEKKIKYIFSMLLITFVFHYSALIGLSFIIIKKIKLRYTLLAVLLLPIFQQILIIILKNYNHRYIYYLSQNIKSPLSSQVIIYIILGAIVHFLEKFKKKENTFYKKVFWIGILLYIILNETIGGHLGFRIGMYMIFFVVVYIPTILDYFKNKKIVQIILITFFLVLGQISLTNAINIESEFESGRRKNFKFEMNVNLNKTENNFEEREFPN